MSYSRDLLRLLDDPDISEPQESQEVVSKLLEKLYASEAMTLAEKTFICRKLPLIHSSENLDQPLDPYDFPLCEEVLFRIRYIIYFNNVNGWYPALDWRGEIPPVQKEKDLQLINRHYSLWSEVINRTDHNDGILQHISKETRHHIKEIKRFCKRQFVGSNRRDYLIKSLVLHSKYMHYVVLEFYEENEQVELLEFEGKFIRIDAFSFIHILFRHYAQIIKEYQVGKSYHGELIDYKDLPKELMKFIGNYLSIAANSFDSQKIYFTLENQLYAIWFRSIKRDVHGGQTVEELRVQTFYPVDDPKELERVSEYYDHSVVINNIEYHLPE